MEDYFQAKARLFTPERPPRRGQPRRRVRPPARRGDGPGRHLLRADAGRRLAGRGRDSRPTGGHVHRRRPRATLTPRSPLPGAFNVANTLAAIAALARRAGSTRRRRRRASPPTRGVPGRLERVDARTAATLAVVDYAHKPDAVEAVLRALRPATPGPAGRRPRRRRRPGPRQAARDGRRRGRRRRHRRRDRRQPPLARTRSRSGPRCSRAPRGRPADERGDGARGRRPRGPPPSPPRSRRAQRAGRHVAGRRQGPRAGQDVAGVVRPFDDRDELRAALARWRRPPTGSAPRDRAVPAEIAAVTGGSSHDIAGRRRRPRGRRPGRHRLPRGAARRPVRRPWSASTPTATTSSRGAVERGAVAVLATRPSTACPCVVVDDVQDGLRRARPRRRRPAARPGRRRHHRLVGQDQHQGPARPGARRGRRRPWRRWARSTPRSACRSPSAGSPPTPASSSSRWAPAASATSRYLTRIAPPRIGVVLNVGTAHVGRVRLPRGDRHGQGRARRGAAAPTGVAVLNADDPRCGRWPRGPRPGWCSSARPTTPTSAPPTSRSTTGGRASFTAAHPGGRRSRCSSACTASTTSATPWPWPPWPSSSACRRRRSPRALESAPGRVSRWRMEVIERADGVTVVNDAYNANPDSMRAALTALGAMGARPAPTWAVLGKMLELGDELDRRARRDRAAGGRGSASTSSSSVGAAALADREPAPRQRGLVGQEPVRGCRTPTRLRRCSRRAARRRRRAVQVEPRRRATVAR